MNTYLPWLMLALLGAYHGINPAMGWLFAVGLGLQEQRRGARAAGGAARAGVLIHTLPMGPRSRNFWMRCSSWSRTPA